MNEQENKPEKEMTEEETLAYLNSIKEFHEHLSKESRYHGLMALSLLFDLIFVILTFILLCAYGLFTWPFWVAGGLFIINKALRDILS